MSACESACTEVTDLGDATVTNEYILRLDVSMHYLASMQVGHAS